MRNSLSVSIIIPLIDQPGTAMTQPVMLLTAPMVMMWILCRCHRLMSQQWQVLVPNHRMRTLAKFPQIRYISFSTRVSETSFNDDKFVGADILFYKEISATSNSWLSQIVIYLTERTQIHNLYSWCCANLKSEQFQTQADDILI